MGRSRLGKEEDVAMPPAEGPSAPPANGVGAGDDGGVTRGPDVDPSRSQLDRKLYRHVVLGNGLRCLLVCDTATLRARRAGGLYDEDESDEGSGDGEDSECRGEGGDSDDDDDYEEEEDGLRKAAAALLVNVGSYHDPPYLQGLSHFLEHMLFLGE